MAGRPGGHGSHPIHMHPVRHPVLESMLLTPRNVSFFFSFCLINNPVPPGSAFVSILRDLVRRLDVVLGTLYMLFKGLRSADICIAYVSCEERLTSTVRMEASVGSLNR